MNSTDSNNLERYLELIRSNYLYLRIPKPSSLDKYQMLIFTLYLEWLILKVIFDSSLFQQLWRKMVIKSEHFHFIEF